MDTLNQQAPRGSSELPYRFTGSAKSNLRINPDTTWIGTPFPIHEDNIRTDEVLDFLRELRKQLRRPLITCWDRWQVHPSAAKRVAASRLRGIDFEWLPAYAPELNPAEARWSNAKHAELANFVPDDTRHLKRNVQSTLTRQGHNHPAQNALLHNR